MIIMLFNQNVKIDAELRYPSHSQNVQYGLVTHLHLTIHVCMCWNGVFVNLYTEAGMSGYVCR